MKDLNKSTYFLQTIRYARTIPKPDPWAPRRSRDVRWPPRKQRCCPGGKSIFFELLFNVQISKIHVPKTADRDKRISDLIKSTGRPFPRFSRRSTGRPFPRFWIYGTTALLTGRPSCSTGRPGCPRGDHVAHGAEGMNLTGCRFAIQMCSVPE